MFISINIIIRIIMSIRIIIIISIIISIIIGIRIIIIIRIIISTRQPLPQKGLEDLLMLHTG